MKGLIRKSAGVLGGEARVRDTRIPVWLLSRFMDLGRTQEDLLRDYPDLTLEDLEAVEKYCEMFPKEIRDAIAADEVDS